jgi:phosphomevalonate kinase
MPICPVAPFCFVVSASLLLYLRSKKVRNPKKLENEQVTRNTFGNDFEVTISSPGKVLVAGGYLILEKPNVGISVGTTSRFYTTIKYLSNKGSETSSNFLAITVDSPQFQIVYNYQFDLTTFQLNRLSKDGNEFIEGCISDTLLFIIESMGLPQFLQFANEINRRNQSIGIKLRAHNDFYSQIKLLLKLKKPLTTKSLLDIPSFSVPGTIFSR